MEKKFQKYIPFILQFIDGVRFTASSLSNLVNDLSEGIHMVKFKFEHNYKKCETCGTKFTFCDCFLEYTNFKDDLIEYKCLYCNISYQPKLDEKLNERFFNTYKFSNHDNNKFISLSQKGVYHYKYMDCEKFNETMLPEKEDFYSNLDMEDITDANYVQAKRVGKDFETKHLGEYHDSYVQSNRLLLADVFDNFNVCIQSKIISFD